MDHSSKATNFGDFYFDGNRKKLNSNRYSISNEQSQIGRPAPVWLANDGIRKITAGYMQLLKRFF